MNIIINDPSKCLDEYSALFKQDAYNRVEYNTWRTLVKNQQFQWNIVFNPDEHEIEIYVKQQLCAVFHSLDNGFGTYLADKFFEVELNNVATPAFKNNTIIIEKEKENMFNFDFGTCENANIRMSLYGLAVKNTSGAWVAYDATKGSIVDVDILNFEGGKYFYKIPTALKDVAAGQVIIHNRVPMIVINAEDKNNIMAVDPVAGEKKVILPTKSPFGFEFVTRVVSMFDMCGAKPEANAENPFGNILPFLLMEGNKDIDPMMLMCMSGGKMDMSNPMMMYFLFKDGDKSDMLPLLLMAQNK